MQADLSKETCERLFQDRCLAEDLEVDGPILLSIQRSLVSSDRDEAEVAAYVTRDRKQKKGS